MKIRQIVVVGLVAGLALGPAGTLAQMESGQGMRGSPPGSGPMMQMQGLMEQMQGMMQQMGEMLKGGSMSPEQMKRMGELMEQMSGMMGRMHGMGMMHGGMMGGIGSGARGPEMMQQMSQMMQHMADMQKRMSEVMGMPQGEKK